MFVCVLCHYFIRKLWYTYLIAIKQKLEHIQIDPFTLRFYLFDAAIACCHVSYVYFILRMHYIVWYFSGKKREEKPNLSRKNHFANLKLTGTYAILNSNVCTWADGIEDMNFNSSQTHIKLMTTINIWMASVRAVYTNGKCQSHSAQLVNNYCQSNW